MKNVVEPQDAAVGDHTPNAAAAVLRESDTSSVRHELEEILANHHFHTSKRCAAFLRYVVEQTLAGRQELKERSIGVEAFGRIPAYDSNADPVVRMTASEVRKRLALYYQDAGSTSDLRIELPVGSYVPRFRFSVGVAGASEPSAAEPSSGDPTAIQPITVVASPAMLPAQVHRPPRKLFLWLAAFVVVLVFASGWSVWHMQHRDLDAHRTALERFWGPVLASPDPALISIGQIRPSDVQVQPNTLRSSLSGPMDIGDNGHYPREIAVAVLGDALAMTDVAVLLRSHQKQFNIHPESSTSFGELQRGPFILIGAFDNDWTIMLTDPLRFHFVMDNTTKYTWISDREQPDAKFGNVAPGKPTQLKSDYAVVVRMYDSRAKQPVVIAAGVSPYGTQAAGEFLSDPVSTAELGRRLPGDWINRNVEVLIKTDLIDGEPGPASIVAATTW